MSAFLLGERPLEILMQNLFLLKIIGSKQKVLKLGTELFAWNSSPDESQRTKEGHQIKIFSYNTIVELWKLTLFEIFSKLFTW